MGKRTQYGLKRTKRFVVEWCYNWGIPLEKVWLKSFRMNKTQFLILCIRTFISPKVNTPNYRALSLEKKVVMYLYYLKDTASLWMSANTFNVHQCTVTKVVMEVCKAIVNYLSKKMIKIPLTQVLLIKVWTGASIWLHELHPHTN